jgi:hypothetical protein
MTEWSLHWLEAEGELAPWRSQIAAEIEATKTIIAGHIAPPRLDILVQHIPGWVIPEIGLVGHTYRRSLFSLTVDPANANFAPSLTDGTLRRQVAHEVHHCLRHAGPGHGRSLGEALVSEGLAGQFVTHLFAAQPEPWERAVEPAVANRLFPDNAALAAADYDHQAWFYGGGVYPRWLGYTLGYMIAQRWLDTAPEANATMLVNVTANEVLAAWTSAKRRF